MAEDDGFLGRWSRRKVAARAGQPLPEAPPAEAAPRPVPAATVAPAVPVAAPETPPPPPAPTLDDVARLTPESDFSAFVQGGVTPEVKNAAMKKLFSDPHFNVMDGLDIYIDDYSQSDPLPLELAKKLASAQFMKLFDEPEQAPPAHETKNDNETTPPPQEAGDNPPTT